MRWNFNLSNGDVHTKFCSLWSMQILGRAPSSTSWKMLSGAASESGHGEAKHVFYQNFHNPYPSLPKMYFQMQMANVLL